MSTIRDLISGALSEIGVLAAGETPSAADQNFCFLSLNRMLDRWSTQNLLIFSNVIETFTLIGGKQVYSMGPSGDFSTTRPVDLSRVGIIYTNNAEIPVDILNDDQWAEIVVKNTPSNLPTKVYPQFTFPLISLSFYPVPTQANQVVVYSNKALTAFTSVNQVLSVPPGYEDALLYNLAVRIAPSFGKQLDPLVIEQANNSKAEIKRQNIKPLYLSTDPALQASGKPFNWITGE